MSYLHFDKTLMTNLEDSLPKEVIRTNRSGAYSCSSVLGCNTSKYHGLLVTPVKEIDDDNHVLLSSLDETVIQHGAEFNLAIHKYLGGTFSPNGHKYIREFDWDKIPTTIYRVGGVELKKETVFQHGENRILIRYTLLQAHSVTTLRLSPFLAFRSVRQYTHENSVASRAYQEVDNGIKTRMYENYPELYMQTSKPCEFCFRPDWYRGLEYPKDQAVGYDYSEDLYVPGYFEFEIKKNESVIFSAGVNELPSHTMHELFDHEVDVHASRDSFYHCLVAAAHQFHNLKGEENYIIAGYPWFKCRARDTFVSLPGLTLAVDEVDTFEVIMRTALKAVDDFIEGKPLSVAVTEIEHPDVLLWAIWCIQQYGKFVSRKDARDKYGYMVERIINFILSGKYPNLYLHDNGLLYTNGRDKAVTWMNSTLNGRPVVPRSGYIVEINGLWYNALMYYSDMCMESGNQEKAFEMQKMAENTGASFKKTFLNEYGYLLDYVDGSFISWDVRPNMVIAASMEYTPLTLQERKRILDICTCELLTVKGLRSLTPKSGAYNPIYEGGQAQRDATYHQGTVWPWLTGFYLETYMKIYKRSNLSFVERQLVGLEDEMFYHCLGTLPELFDGNPPFHGRGAMAYAMNVAETLRTMKLLSKFYNY